MKKTSQTKSASTEANAQKTQTPIVAKLNGYHARTVLHKSRMEFAFLSNSIMICIICKKGIKYPKNIKSPCKIRIRLVWHNQYNTSARKKQVFERKENKIVFRWLFDCALIYSILSRPLPSRCREPPSPRERAYFYKVLNFFLAVFIVIRLLLCPTSAAVGGSHLPRKRGRLGATLLSYEAAEGYSEPFSAYRRISTLLKEQAPFQTLAP